MAAEGFSHEAEGYVDPWHLNANCRRVSNLESTVRSLATGQTQIQMALQQILSMLPQNNFSTTPSSVPSFLSQQGDNGVPTANIFQTSVSPPDIFHTSPHNAQMFPGPVPISPQNTASGRLLEGKRSRDRKRPGDFPKLPGFAPPVSAARSNVSNPHSRLINSEHTESFPYPPLPPLHHALVDLLSPQIAQAPPIQLYRMISSLRLYKLCKHWQTPRIKREREMARMTMTAGKGRMRGSR